MTRQRRAVIVGGGIVGLATAYTLSRPPYGWRVTVLEKEEAVARHQSGRNSGVIHSGLYYTPGSVKALTCVRGRALLEAFCDAHGVPWRRSGKVVVAVDGSERARLPALAERARANGVDCELLDASGLREKEPHIAGVAALWVPISGVVDYGEVSRALAAAISQAGGDVRTGVSVRAIRSGADIVVDSDAGEMPADAAINCAGLWSDRLAQASEGKPPPVHILPFRGEYHRLSDAAAARVRGLVYPVPDPRFPFLGVHLTRHVDDVVTAGPNAVLALARDGYAWGRVVPRDVLAALRSPGLHKLALKYPRTGLHEVWRSLNRRAFLKAAQRLMPSLTLGDLRPHRAGVRAQAVDVDRGGELADDFRLLSPRPGVVHVLNAPSPAATACLAIAERIAALATRGG